MVLALHSNRHVVSSRQPTFQGCWGPHDVTVLFSHSSWAAETFTARGPAECPAPPPSAYICPAPPPPSTQLSLLPSSISTQTTPPAHCSISQGYDDLERGRAVRRRLVFCSQWIHSEVKVCIVSALPTHDRCSIGSCYHMPALFSAHQHSLLSCIPPYAWRSLFWGGGSLKQGASAGPGRVDGGIRSLCCSPVVLRLYCQNLI